VEAPAGASVRATSRLLLFPGGTSETDIDSPELIAKIRGDAETIFRLKESACIRYQGRGSADVFLEFIGPPARLVIFGGGADAVPLAIFSTALGWDVVVVDHRSVQATASRFRHPSITVLQSTDDLANVPLEPDSMAVVMTHSYERDRVLLRSLLRRPLRYLGVLGPRERTRRLLAELANGAPQNGSLHFPVGLDIGSESPVTTALAIAAEMQAVLAGRSGGMLRDRPGPIHKDVPRVRTRQAAGAVGM
jgi:xanthine/CO dehydrogenase XdhC/CoxF family maturation factor